jgi:hypothetical protein
MAGAFRAFANAVIALPLVLSCTTGHGLQTRLGDAGTEDGAQASLPDARKDPAFYADAAPETAATDCGSQWHGALRSPLQNTTHPSMIRLADL